MTLRDEIARALLRQIADGYTADASAHVIAGIAADAILPIVERAVMAERERCAKVARDSWDQHQRTIRAGGAGV